MMKAFFAIFCIILGSATCQRLPAQKVAGRDKTQGMPFSDNEMEKRANEIYRDLLQEEKKYLKLENKIELVHSSGS